jgi:PAS domain S-box-containing protein
MTRQPGERLRLLVADGDPGFTDGVTEAIAAADADATAAGVTGGPEAVARARRAQDELDAVLVGDGLADPVGTIGGVAGSTDLPVVLVTDPGADAEVLDAAAAAGATDYLPRSTAAAQYEPLLERLRAPAAGDDPPSASASADRARAGFADRERAIRHLQATTERMQDAESATRVAEVAVEAAAEALGLPVAACWFHDAGADRLEPVAATDAVHDRDLLDPLSSDRYEYAAFREGEVVTYAPHDENPENPLETAVLLPLGEHGLVAAGRPDQAAYDEVTLDVARTLAAHTATALDRIERERTIRTSERRLRLIAEHIDEIVYLAAADFSEILYVNPAYEEIYGRPVEELYADPTSFVEAAHPEDRDRYEADVRRLIADVEAGDPEDAYRGEYRIRRDGETRWVTVTRFPIEDDDGTVDRIVGRVRDVTERRRREREYEQIFDGVNDAIAVFDPETGDIVDVNDTYHELLGYADLETIRQLGIEGLSVTEEGYTGEEGRRLVREVAESGEPTTVEWRGEREDGEHLWLEATLAPAEIGGERRVLSIQRDVTERKRREREYERIFHGVNDSITVHDPETAELLDVNDTFCELLGYDREEILEMGIEGYSPSDRGYTLAEASEFVREVLDADEPQQTEWAVETSDGEIRWLAVKGTTVEIGGELRYVSLNRDVTERREREQRLEVFNRVLRHNLRNQLDVIKSHAEGLGEDAGGVHARRIIDAADRLARMGNRARTVDRLMSRDVAEAEVDLSECVRDELATFDAADRGVSVTLDLPDSARVVTDGEAVETALESALDNAVRHADSAVTVAVDSDPGGYTVTVDDDGPGISAAELEPIDAETETPLRHGRGLGLWQLKWSVQTFNGTLSFDTEAGTTVRISVPDLRPPAE